MWGLAFKVAINFGDKLRRDSSVVIPPLLPPPEGDMFSGSGLSWILINSLLLTHFLNANYQTAPLYLSFGSYNYLRLNG